MGLGWYFLQKKKKKQKKDALNEKRNWESNLYGGKRKEKEKKRTDASKMSCVETINRVKEISQSASQSLFRGIPETAYPAKTVHTECVISLDDDGLRPTGLPDPGREMWVPPLRACYPKRQFRAGAGATASPLRRSELRATYLPTYLTTLPFGAGILGDYAMSVGQEIPVVVLSHRKSDSKSHTTRCEETARWRSWLRTPTESGRERFPR